MTKKYAYTAAGLILLAALALAFFSLRGDSITTDESPHIVSGYSYLTQKDMRLNPEHPPLIKDLAALPLLFQNINFDTGHPSWINDINGQWSAGSHFLYESGNNPETIALSARGAILLIFALLGLLVFKITKDKYGRAAALVALALTVFSPNILAHGRYVTTDIGASLGFLLAIYCLTRFLDKPGGWNLALAGASFGLAQLLKFSCFLLIPLYGFVLLVFYVSQNYQERHWGQSIFKLVKNLLAIIVIGYLLVWPVYQYHTWNYPTERQKNDTEIILNSFSYKPAANLVVQMTEKPILRPYAQYLLGLLMVMQRSGGGNTAYFLGEVSSTAWKSYFPVVYLLKEPVPVLIIMLVAVYYWFKRIFGTKKSLARLAEWVQKKPFEFAGLSFIVLYWTTSILGNLNIGLRHILPTLPFFYILAAGKITEWFREKKTISSRVGRGVLVFILMLWFITESVLTFPFYLSYFNTLAGGPANGYRYVADSNLDWGQDLKRLASFVEANNIEKIRLDYFGGGSPSYYLGDKYEKLDAGDISQRNGWLAVSATLLQGGRAAAAQGFDQNTTYYKWLDKYEPVAEIGYSIFVYKLD